jgi:tetratricopeptide (TPR) repeat protein
LGQGRDPFQAIGYIEKIVGPRGPSSWSRWTANGQTIDAYWSLKAWALAEMGRGAEAAEAVAEALRTTNCNSRPDLAATYRRVGLAMQALDRQAEAADYLEKASEADPQGRWSTLARQSLGQRRIRTA